MFLLKEHAFGIEHINLGILGRKRMASLLILVLDGRMSVFWNLKQTPDDKTAPATPNHNVYMIEHHLWCFWKKLKDYKSPEEEVYILEMIFQLFCSENRYVSSQGNDAGIKDLTVVENTHLPLRCGNVHVSFSRQGHHKPVLAQSHVSIW